MYWIIFPNEKLLLGSNDHPFYIILLNTFYVGKPINQMENITKEINDFISCFNVGFVPHFIYKFLTEISDRFAIRKPLKSYKSYKDQVTDILRKRQNYSNYQFSISEP